MLYDLFYASRSDIDESKWLEFKTRFPNAQKIENIENFEQLSTESFTKMFWVVWDDLIVRDDFDFSHRATKWDLQYVHVFKNKDYYDGICLFPKNLKITNRELDNRFFVHKKEIDIIASDPDPKTLEFDVVFISYKEPNADKNWNSLLSKAPNAKRVHGVKGIHQAHIEAAKLCSTEMFWVVDGDAELVNDFEFNYQVPVWDRDSVHVWRSKNPINDLEYGYGGVKLLPREATLNMKTDTADMTTSISNKFKPVPYVSNITVFNTDEFNTWKSAFRECVKLSSRTIRGQVDEETERRLQIWTTVGAERRFGNSAIQGARSGMEFGRNNIGNITELSRINDFDWLEEKFNEV